MPRTRGRRSPGHRTRGRRTTGRITTGRRTTGRRTTGRMRRGVGPGNLFVNTVSIGTTVTVRLSNSNVITGRYFGLVNGLITIGSNFIDPNDIVAFSV